MDLDSQQRVSLPVQDDCSCTAGSLPHSAGSNLTSDNGLLACCRAVCSVCQYLILLVDLQAKGQEPAKQQQLQEALQLQELPLPQAVSTSFTPVKQANKLAGLSPARYAGLSPAHLASPRCTTSTSALSHRKHLTIKACDTQSMLGTDTKHVTD